MSHNLDAQPEEKQIMQDVSKIQTLLNTYKPDQIRLAFYKTCKEDKASNLRTAHIKILEALRDKEMSDKEQVNTHEPEA